MLDKFQSVPAITRQIREGGYEYYFVLDGADRAGYFALAPDTDEDRWLQLSKLYVKHPFRGRGIGREVVAWIEEECVRRNIQQLWLTVNKDNAGPIAFYERVGFAIVDAMVTDIGGGFVMDDYRMVKRI